MSDISPKITNPSKNINSLSKPSFNFYLGKVVDTKDPTDAGRIKVRIKGVDDKMDNGDQDELLYTLPLIPKHIGIVPQIGEMVFVFILESNKPQGDRFYVGPIISQPHNLKNDQYFGSAPSAFKNGRIIALDVAPSNVKDALGIYPQQDEIYFSGRDNADLLFRSNQSVLRAGKFEYNNPLKFNKQNPSYIKCQYQAPIKVDSNTNETTYGSVNSIVADKLLLLTHDGFKNKINNYLLSTPNKEIDANSLIDIIANACSAVYGEILIKFLELQMDFNLNHTHKYHNMPPTLIHSDKLRIFNLQDILAKNIKIV